MCCDCGIVNSNSNEAMIVSGFGYGETEGVELTERLMQLYSARLDGTAAAGL